MAPHRSATVGDMKLPGRARQAFADWSMQFRRVEPADFSRLAPRPDATPEHIRNLVPLLEAFMAEEPLV